MASRLAPFTYTRPERVGKTYTLTDPNLPALTFDFFLAPHDEESEQAALELGFDKIAEYIDGDEFEGASASDFPAVGGRTVKLTKTMCHTAANITLLQMPQPGMESYSFEEMIGISLTTPTLWKSLQKLAVNFKQKSKQSEKNGSGELSATASGSPSAG